MNNFNFKKYFGNLVGMPTTVNQPKPKLQKAVSDSRLVKRK